MQNALLNMRCLAEACKRSNIPFRVHDEFGNVVSVRLSTEYFFVNFTMPFNNDAVSYICKDKEFSYRLLKDAVRMPQTLGFFDPAYENERFAQFKKEKSIVEIAQKILSAFSLPVMVKMNSGSRCINVFWCDRADKILLALAAIFKKDARNYDYIALGQEYIAPAREFRVIAFRKKVLLVYRKEISLDRNLTAWSHMRYKDAKTVHITDTKMCARFEQFLLPVFDAVPIEFCGADIIEDAKGEWYLLELNTMPGFHPFVRCNGEEPVVRMYGEILRML